MANAGAKKRVDENKKHLQNLKIAIAVGVAAYVLVRLLLRGGYASTWHIVGLAGTFILEVFAFQAINNFAEPEYGANGELVYGGADLSMGGMCGYWHDLLYISVFVQVATCITTWFWFTLLIVPGFAGYLLWVNVLQPYMSAPRAEPEMDEGSRRRMERTQQRAERRKMKWR
ncbi:hypothetical protein HYH03_015801 [Edaphochlamys debaryana]|uniref:Transmembrane protein n=1 Tax=Edaphochlamys debaryana TaxID=47281 RepID=A0A835XSY6_9CHLO|nr:hypothetical protein HYH03_015801 [Edaphochlamys debaryana]|eukprot:KAG2485419.1 hypothetical protein HYH03_015801 [Edaphochlamys debaryana]